jgi:hypothetical protein
MFVFGLRPVTAAALSLWLGVLACLLGCAKPADASTQRLAAEIGVTSCPEGGEDAGDSCCQHGHDSQGNPNKGSHHAKSCCPTETALAERKAAPIVQVVSVDLEALAMPVAGASHMVLVSSDANIPTSWHSGQDILRRVHVLRI